MTHSTDESVMQGVKGDLKDIRLWDLRTEEAYWIKSETSTRTKKGSWVTFYEGF